MDITKKPITGMKDILPSEMKIRNYCINVINDVYSKYGFLSIETPAVESISNLNSKQGGENEKLIFKILNRGEKLDLENPNKISDSGLRYDLTLPLVRYYANNSANLPNPFKALQMGNVWRADRPQKGRYRQFMQCDIDILGDSTNLAEIELINATTTVLGKLNFEDFKIRINDRKLLKSIALYSGICEDDYEKAFIILDKMDKIGIEGVKQEFLKNDFDEKQTASFLNLFEKIENIEYDKRLDFVSKKLGKDVENIINNLKEIIDGVNPLKSAKFEIIFDPTLVRGMNYYTGPIFEIAIPQFGGSCGGGGRYDKMVGNFTGTDVPACGFSIGFERIVLLLMENGFKIPDEKEKYVFFVEKGISNIKLLEILKEAENERKLGKEVLVIRMNKNKKFQKQRLQEEGYTNIKEFYENPIDKN